MLGVVETAGGKLRGEQVDGVWRFLGVPYAAAPTGEDRWRPPRPAAEWSGLLDASARGPVAPQPPPSPGTSVPGDPDVQDEDCLHLCIWTPGLDDRRRPVMVWIHGGGFTSGTGGSLLYDGARLAARGDVVVVTVNYRLGALGFLGHPALATGGSGYANWGLLDQVAALRWVREHAGAFGGDPHTVTVFGESAGAMSIAALLVMPSARGLFSRAVLQSGPAYAFSAGRGADAAAEVARELGLPEVRREQLCEVPAADLVGAVAAVQARTPRPGELPLPLLPVVDGVTLPRHPLEGVAAGAAAGIPLLLGTNRDELAYFALTEPSLASISDEQLAILMARSAPETDPTTVLGHYRTVRQDRGEAVGPRELWIAAASDLVFRWPTLRLAAAQHHHERSTYTYLFTWESPVFDGILGSCHALEIPFVFGAVRDPVIAKFSGSGPAAERLSDAMADAWVAFARTGDPSAPGVGEWSAWDAATGRTMVLGAQTSLEAFPRHDELSVWADAYPLAGAAAAGSGLGA